MREAAAAAGVDLHAALNRLGGKRELYQRVLHIFIKDLATMPAQLRAHAAQGQAQPAAHLLHTLKGLAATLGAMALSAEAARGEKLLAGAAAPVEVADVADVAGVADVAHVADVAETAERACAAIATARPGLAALLQALQAEQAADAGPAMPSGDAPGMPVATALDTHALQTLLQAMAGQLRNADMAATDAMAELQRQFGDTLGEQLQPMNEAIEALDFERALGLCNALADERINELTGGQPA